MVPRYTLENDRLRLEVREQALDTALASDAGLLESAEGDTEIGTKGIVTHCA